MYLRHVQCSTQLKRTFTRFSHYMYQCYAKKKFQFLVLKILWCWQKLAQLCLHGPLMLKGHKKLNSKMSKRSNLVNHSIVPNLFPVLYNFKGFTAKMINFQNILYQILEKVILLWVLKWYSIWHYLKERVKNLFNVVFREAI